MDDATIHRALDQVEGAVERLNLAWKSVVDASAAYYRSKNTLAGARDDKEWKALWWKHREAALSWRKAMRAYTGEPAAYALDGVAPDPR